MRPRENWIMRPGFQRYGQRIRRETESPDATATGPAGGARRQVVLERWILRARHRRKQIADQLAAAPVGPQQKQRIKLWLQTLAAREAWLEARLEHLKATANILKSVVD